MAFSILIKLSLSACSTSVLSTGSVPVIVAFEARHSALSLPRTYTCEYNVTTYTFHREKYRGWKREFILCNFWSWNGSIYIRVFIEFLRSEVVKWALKYSSYMYSHDDGNTAIYSGKLSRELIRRCENTMRLIRRQLYSSMPTFRWMPSNTWQKAGCLPQCYQ